MKRLTLVLGAGGQLGEAMTSLLGRRDEVVARSRAELDVSDAAAVLGEVASVCPDVILNCAAYTSVDGAEQAPGSALAINSLAIRTLARAGPRAGASGVQAQILLQRLGPEPQPRIRPVRVEDQHADVAGARRAPVDGRAGI